METDKSTRNTLGLAVLLIVLASSIGVQTYKSNEKLDQLITLEQEANKQRTSVTKWEYDVVSIGDLEWGTKGEKLGAEGWEIVATRRASDSDKNFLYECIVKRPR